MSSFSGNIGHKELFSQPLTHQLATDLYILFCAIFMPKKQMYMYNHHTSHSTTKSSFTNLIPDLYPDRAQPPSLPCSISQLLDFFVQFKVRPDELPENQIRPEVKMTLGLLGGSRFDG